MTLTQMIRADHTRKEQHRRKFDAKQVRPEERDADLPGLNRASARGRAARLEQRIDEFSSQNQRQDCGAYPHPWPQPLAFLR